MTRRNAQADDPAAFTPMYHDRPRPQPSNQGQVVASNLYPNPDQSVQVREEEPIFKMIFNKWLWICIAVLILTTICLASCPVTATLMKLVE